MEFASKVVVITGASSGIGAATAEQFAKLSANLVLVGRNRVNLTKTAELCKGLRAKVHAVIADVSVDADAERIIGETISTFGRLDVLVNNAGIADRSGVLDGISSYDKVMNTNARAVFLLSGLAAPYLIKSKGNIVNVSSVASVQPSSKVPAYNMSKAALDMFTKCLALELAPHVRVNSVNPGVTKTKIFNASGLNDAQTEIVLKLSAMKAPLERVAECDEVADLIVFLAGKKARGMTGSIVFTDNGYLLIGPEYSTDKRAKIQ